MINDCGFQLTGISMRNAFTLKFVRATRAGIVRLPFSLFPSISVTNGMVGTTGNVLVGDSK